MTSNKTLNRKIGDVLYNTLDEIIHKKLITNVTQDVDVEDQLLVILVDKFEEPLEFDLDNYLLINQYTYEPEQN